VLDAFPEWIVEHCTSASTALEIGAGEGKYGYPERVRATVETLVGVDPDDAILRNPFLDERYHLSIQEFAASAVDRFDLAYAFFVLEHVESPPEFLAACHRLLKPGGSLFAATPNVWHYFGLSTKLSGRIGVEEWLLERLRGEEMARSYHFPTFYRLNSVARLRRLLRRAGFSRVEFRVFDEASRFAQYFPPAIRWFPNRYSAAVHRLRFSPAMGMLMLKATI